MRALFNTLTPLHVQKPRHFLLHVIVVTCVRLRGDQSYRVRLQELVSGHLTTRVADRYVFEENLEISDL